MAGGETKWGADANSLELDSAPDFELYRTTPGLRSVVRWLPLSSSAALTVHCPESQSGEPSAVPLSAVSVS